MFSVCSARLIHTFADSLRNCVYLWHTCLFTNVRVILNRCCIQQLARASDAWPKPHARWSVHVMNKCLEMKFVLNFFNILFKWYVGFYENDSICFSVICYLCIFMSERYLMFQFNQMFRKMYRMRIIKVDWMICEIFIWTACKKIERCQNILTSFVS